MDGVEQVDPPEPGTGVNIAVTDALYPEEPAQGLQGGQEHQEVEELQVVLELRRGKELQGVQGPQVIQELQGIQESESNMVKIQVRSLSNLI